MPVGCLRVRPSPARPRGGATWQSATVIGPRPPCLETPLFFANHTIRSGSISFYEPDRQLLFTGDTIFSGGILGGIFPSGNISDYALTLRQLSTLRVKEYHPGHGKRSEAPSEDFEKAVKGSVNLLNDTRSLFQAFDLPKIERRAL